MVDGCSFLAALVTCEMICFQEVFVMVISKLALALLISRVST